MKKALLLANRDFRIYTKSMVAYVVTGIFLLVAGYFFFAKMSYISALSMNAMSNPVQAEQINFSNIFLELLFGDVAVILLMLLPLVTMRTFSEEKKSGTFELLVTYPIRDWQIVVGKFISCALALFVMTTAVLCHVAIAVGVGGELYWPQLVSGFVGVNLVGLAFVATGVFTSSLTENQIVAAVSAFGFLLLFWVLGWSSELTSGLASDVLSELSLFSHAENLYRGIVSLKDIAFYVLFIGFFLFATLRVLEVRKWRG